MVFNQYINYHNEYMKKYGKETVIFMQVGSFFELYGIYQDDKIIGCDVIKISEILNVQYTKKDKKNPDNILSNPVNTESIAGCPAFYKVNLLILLKNLNSINKPLKGLNIYKLTQ